MAGTALLVRGEILYFLADPGESTGDHDGLDVSSVVHHADGGLLVEDGRVARSGDWAAVAADAPPGTPVADHRGQLVLPGFIDTHVHYPQLDVIAAPGRGLLDWLERYTFPAEERFADPVVAAEAAAFFCDELLRNGTTTALAFGTVHAGSVDALFGAARARGMRLVAGKVMMDRHCPPALRDSAQACYDDGKALIGRWHGRDRLGYAVTPRFAITSSEAQLEAAGALAREHPEVAVQSHVAESLDEVARVRELFPLARSYLDVYDHHGLLRPGAVYAHCIHLDAADRRRMAESGTTAAFCPTSNLFLGSGLFDLGQALAEGMPVALGSDVGGGTSFSLLRTLGAAYQVAHLKGYVLPPLRAFYLATLAGARALGVQDQVGSFLPGREADFVVLDPDCTPLIARRMARAQSLAERLFVWLTLGDDRAVAATYVMGARWQGGGA